MKGMYICGILIEAGTIIFAILSKTICLWFIIPALIFSVAAKLLMIVTSKVEKQKLKIITIGDKRRKMV